MKKERFEAITDAVMAIVLTLMVMQINIPEPSAANAMKIIQQVSIYIISFATIAVVWMNHHNMFAHVKKIDMDLVWINFCLLFFTSLIPLATAPLSESFHHQANHVFYGLVTGTVSLFYTLLQLRANKLLDDQKYRGIVAANWLTVALYYAAVPLSFVSVYISGAIFVLIPTFYFIVSRKPVN